MASSDGPDPATDPKKDLRTDLQKAVTSVAGYVAARETQIADLIERTAGKVDDRTEHRYTSTIDRVKAGLHTGVAKLVEQKSDEADQADEADQPHRDDRPGD